MCDELHQHLHKRVSLKLVCLSLSNQKSGAGGKKTQKSAEESDSEEEEPSPDVDEDDEDKHAVEQPPHPSTASWFSDHNYIAVTPEKTPPMSPTVLNKKCMYLFKGLRLLMKPHHCFSIITVFCHGSAIKRFSAQLIRDELG